MRFRALNHVSIVHVCTHPEPLMRGALDPCPGDVEGQPLGPAIATRSVELTPELERMGFRGINGLWICQIKRAENGKRAWFKEPPKGDRLRPKNYLKKYMERGAFVWFIVDLEPKRVVDVHLTVNSRTSYDVMHMVKRLGLDVEYIHDGGPWYRALDWMDVSHRRERFKRRNIVEQAFRSLKHRIKRSSYFRGSLARALSWLKAFTYVYNLVISITQEVMAV